MSTPAQIAANIANAQFSTGARTPEGHAKSSKNSVVFGLFSGDFIRPGEETAYAALNESLLRDLAPVGALEEIHATEIQRAAWRLRRCGDVESHLVIRLDEDNRYILDPMETSDSNAERIQKSVDRARSQAHRLLHKATAELRKLQTQRQFATEFLPPEEDRTRFGLVDWRTLAETNVVNSPNSAKPPVAQGTQSGSAGTPRNAQCPCGSGEKHKRCCGKDAPPVLRAA